MFDHDSIESKHMVLVRPESVPRHFYRVDLFDQVGKNLRSWEFDRCNGKVISYSVGELWGRKTHELNVSVLLDMWYY